MSMSNAVLPTPCVRTHSRLYAAHMRCTREFTTIKVRLRHDAAQCRLSVPLAASHRPRRKH
ncbi:hypothetical protein WI41_11745 [Burkholderia latens]|uniref:Uncharacterized protein n=1 Tax=Burkholderia latens TaxID=488446 RepID=A0AAP1CDL0_9BURK|nr:hypothetical protein WI41_11745 [Burkholderia latens]